MAEYTDYAILFPGGIGTDSMRKEMLIHGKKILYDAKEDL
jgi:predicted Rossmann-fold nucleotide-binding protein